MTGLHAKVGNRQEDFITTITDTLAIDRATYLQDIDTRKEKAQLYVSKIFTYKGKSYFKLQKFTQAYKHIYETWPVTYQNIKNQVMLAKKNLQDSLRNAWYRKYPIEINHNYTWEEFK